MIVELKMQPKADKSSWPEAKGTAPREGGKFGGMRHHGKGEPTTRLMAGAKEEEAIK